MSKVRCIIIVTVQNSILIPLFTWFWHSRLEDWPYIPGYPRYRTVVQVKGWRTAILDGAMGRVTDTFLIKIGRWYL